MYYLIFGVISLTYFKGKLYSCSYSHLKVGENCLIETKWDCLNVGGEWVNKVFNFDDILNAIVNLFVMTTTAGWSEVVFYTLKSTTIDYEPLPALDTFHKDPFWVIFYSVFMLFGSFFFLNLFVGVVVSNFNEEHDKIGGNNLLTTKQKEWIDLKLLVLRSQPLRKLKSPESKFR